MPLLTLALSTGFHLVTSRLARLDDVGTMQFYTGCTGAALATIALPFFRTPLDAGRGRLHVAVHARARAGAGRGRARERVDGALGLLGACGAPPRRPSPAYARFAPKNSSFINLRTSPVAVPTPCLRISRLR